MTMSMINIKDCSDSFRIINHWFKDHWPISFIHKMYKMNKHCTGYCQNWSHAKLKMILFVLLF